MQGESREVSEIFSQPQLKEVVFDNSLEKAPFDVDFNKEQFVNLLQHLGTSDDSIRKLTIRFVVPERTAANPSEINTLGVFDPKTHTISIYPDIGFRFYQQGEIVVQQLISGIRSPDKKAFAELLITNRLPEFLHELAFPSDPEHEPDPERARRVAERLLKDALNKKVQKTLHYESQHVADKNYLLVKAISKGSLILVGVPTSYAFMELMAKGIPKIFGAEEFSCAAETALRCSSLWLSIGAVSLAHYVVDIGEIRARRTASRLQREGLFSDIITIKPKHSLKEAVDFRTQNEETKIDTTESQRQLINNLEIKPIDQLLPKDLYQLYQDNKDLAGKIEKESSEGVKVRITRTRDGIVLVQRLKEDTVRIKYAPKESVSLSDRIRNGISWFKKEPFPIYDIEDYYVLDENNNTGFDFSQLWQNQSNQKIRAVLVPTIMPPVYFKTIEGPILVLSDLSAERDRVVLGGVPENDLPILNLISHAHEVAHLIQNPPVSVHYELDHALQKEAFEYHLQRLGYWLSNLFSKKGKKLTEQDSIAIGKLAKFPGAGENERNAHAFALGVARKLRSRDLDILRGVNQKVVFQLINNVLTKHHERLMNQV